MQQRDESAVGVRGLVCMIRHDLKTGRKYRYITRNIVTNDGDQHYAEKGALQGNTIRGDTTRGFTYSGDGSLSSGVMLVGIAGDAPGKGSIVGNMTTEAAAGARKHFDNGYPTALDTDSDNPLSGTALDICTFRTSYGTTEANSSGIDRVLICESGSTSGSGDPVLMYATFASSVNKTSSDTLKVIVNHTFNGIP